MATVLRLRDRRFGKTTRLDRVSPYQGEILGRDGAHPSKLETPRPSGRLQQILGRAEAHPSELWESLDTAHSPSLRAGLLAATQPSPRLRRGGQEDRILGRDPFDFAQGRLQRILNRGFRG